MKIEIPQPTVLERLNRDLMELQALRQLHEGFEMKAYLQGKIDGLEWAIKNLEANK